jgi:hypothetical protein
MSLSIDLKDTHVITIQFNELYPKMVLFRGFLQDKINQLCVDLFREHIRRYSYVIINSLTTCLQITSVDVIDQMSVVSGDYDYIPPIVKLFRDYGPFPRSHVQRYMKIFSNHDNRSNYKLGSMIKRATPEQDQNEQCTLFEEYFRQYPKLTDEYRRQFYTELGKLSRGDPKCEWTPERAQWVLNQFSDSVYTYHEFVNFENLSWECFEYWWIYGYRPRLNLLKGAGKSVKLMIPRMKDIKWALRNFKGSIWPTLYLTQLLPKPVIVDIPANINVISTELLIQTGKIRVKR